MQPDDYRHIKDRSERRKIQNRNAQRRWREKRLQSAQVRVAPMASMHLMYKAYQSDGLQVTGSSVYVPIRLSTFNSTDDGYDIINDDLRSTESPMSGSDTQSHVVERVPARMPSLADADRIVSGLSLVLRLFPQNTPVPVENVEDGLYQYHLPTMLANAGRESPLRTVAESNGMFLMAAMGIAKFGRPFATSLYSRALSSINSTLTKGDLSICCSDDTLMSIYLLSVNEVCC